VPPPPGPRAGGLDKSPVHTVVVTDAAEADINQLPELMHGEERVLYGDKAYWCEPDRVAYEEAGVQYRVTRRGKRGEPLSERWRKINRARSRKRAFVEHGFLVMKRLWGFDKVRYRGPAKNATRAYAALALTNLFKVRHRCKRPAYPGTWSGGGGCQRSGSSSSKRSVGQPSASLVSTAVR